MRRGEIPPQKSVKRSIRRSLRPSDLREGRGREESGSLSKARKEKRLPVVGEREKKKREARNTWRRGSWGEGMEDGDLRAEKRSLRGGNSGKSHLEKGARGPSALGVGALLGKRGFWRALVEGERNFFCETSS